MCKEQKFYLCKHCGNLVGLINDSGVPLICCGEKMAKLEPNTSDGATEKHVPQVTITDNIVTVDIGSVAHPMIEEHYIMWVYLKTSQGGHRKCLEPGDKPQLNFALYDGEEALVAYAYCNIHGLWSAQIK